jgi:hypothetical protein
MDDKQVLDRIGDLVEEEHTLERQALGQDPDSAQVRPEGTVEGYLQ